MLRIGCRAGAAGAATARTSAMARARITASSRSLPHREHLDPVVVAVRDEDLAGGDAELGGILEGPVLPPEAELPLLEAAVLAQHDDAAPVLIDDVQPAPL